MNIPWKMMATDRVWSHLLAVAAQPLPHDVVLLALAEELELSRQPEQRGVLADNLQRDGVEGARLDNIAWRRCCRLPAATHHR